MSNRNLLNLFLFVFVLLLIVFVVYEPGKDIPVTPPTLTNLDVNDIHTIKISRHNADPAEREISFNKISNGWVMMKPYQLAGNSFRIESILKLLSAVSLSQNNLKNLDEKQFGLDKPHVTITLNKNLNIIFGHNKSLKHHRYVKIGSTLHMITDTFYYQLTAKTDSYISHKVLPAKSKITKLRLPKMELSQTNSRWQITPKISNYSMDSVNKLISEWQLSQAYDVNKIKSKYNTKASIIIQLDNNKLYHFNIEENKNSFNLINIDSRVRYILSADRKNKLLTLPTTDEKN